MPATEETYRRQSTLHVVFAVSSIAMAAVTVWMIMADHLRPWKNTQREFQQVETAKLKASEVAKAQEQERKSFKAIGAIDAEAAKLKDLAAGNALKIRDIDATLKKLKGTFERLDTEKRFLKAELDSQRSFYDGMLDRDEKPRAKDYLAGTIAPNEKKYEKLVRDYEESARAVARETLSRNLLASEVVEVAEMPAPGTPAEVAGFVKGDTMPVAAFAAFRDEAEKVLKAEGAQARAATLTVEVRRKAPPAFQGGEPTEQLVPLKVAVRPSTEKDDQGHAMSGFETVGMVPLPVTPEVLKKRREDLTRDVDRLKRTREQKEAQYGEGSGFSGFVNRTLATFRGLPIIDLAAPPTKIQQISLPDLLINYNFKEVPRYDRCTTCHLGIDRPGYDKDANGHDMAAVFKSHPFLADGATAIDPRGNVVPAGLYLDSNGPHPINKFGCTICHAGQGSGTSFTYASHEPNDLEQKEEWGKKNDWTEMHHWDEPMLPSRFMESSCVKCHHQITDVPQAKKLQAGYQRITKYGCTGCHTIGGEGSFGPDLTDNRQVGPNLKHVGSKVTKEWLVKWIKNPHAFRKDTRMPRFYEVSNNSADEDRPKVHAEVHAMAHYLIAASAPPKEFVDPPVAKGDAEKGKELFFQKGCMACHAHKEYGEGTVPKAVQGYSKANFGPNLSNLAAKFEGADGPKWLTNWLKAPEAYHPKSLMPNLQLSWEDSAHIAAWLLSVKADTLPARWNEADFQVPPVDSKEVGEGLDELTKLYLGKAKTYKKRTVLLSEVDSTVAGMSRDEKLMYVGEKTITRLGCFGCHNIKGYETAKPIGTPLNGWGVKSPAKLDFSHISEYLRDPKNMKRVDKSEAEAYGIDPSREGTPKVATVGGEVASHGKDDHKVNLYDGVDEYWYEKAEEHTRSGFLHQKLHRPRSYDYGKQKDDLKSWDDRLRMPQFTWADDNEAVEEVMTLVLGLTGERIPGKYLPKYTPAKQALAQGEKLLERYNCRGCHVLEMPKYTLAAGTKATVALPDFAQNVESAYNNRSKDYLFLYGKDNPAFAAVGGLTFDEAIKGVRLEEDLKTGKDGKLVDKEGTPVDRKTTLVLGTQGDQAPVTIEGMPTATIEDEGPDGKPTRKVSVELWKPVTIRGFAFNVGDIVAIDPDKVQATAAEGGDFAWLYATATAEKQGVPFSPIWNRLPPPLIREGVKVQTNWLTGFLNDPYPIRPATNLRMPRFHFGSTPGEVAEMGSSGGGKSREEAQGEMTDLANYFAARDGAEFPYQVVAQREQSYLAEREKAHKDYFGGGWSLITKGLCIQCHAVGQYKPATGGQNVNGPALQQVNNRFRDRYLYEWLGRPNRLIPYTAMPQNIEPHGPAAPGAPKSLEGKPAEQVRAIRDTLLNYTSAVEQQLAGSKAAEPPKADAPAPAPKAEGGHED